MNDANEHLSAELGRSNDSLAPPRSGDIGACGSVDAGTATTGLAIHMGITRVWLRLSPTDLPHGYSSAEVTQTCQGTTNLSWVR